MSLLQKSYVDYKNLGDTGVDDPSGIQPFGAGEALASNNLRRPSENLRSRTEIVRDVLEDALYYRDRVSYLIKVAGTGVLEWGGTVALFGTGVVDNTDALTLSPMLTPTANIKGVLAIGTVASNQVSYEVQAGAYASDGMNAITVEHRDVTGTTVPTCVITTGPIKRIVVVFDSAQPTHDSPTVVSAVNSAIGGDADLNGKILAVDNGTAGVAILAMAETGLDVRTHAAGTSGNASADLEAHTLASGALGAFTAIRPLVEGDVLAIRYDYLVEPTGGDANDPKGGVPGGRAESNASRSNSDVAACLFVVQDNPEWLPGAIPLVKIVNNVARWVDGTSVAPGSNAFPGAALGTTIDPSGFAGVPTLTINGGISNVATSIQAAFDSVDDRLGQLRQGTWTLTDGSASTGGHYNGSGALASAMAASAGGGKFSLRRGTYTGLTGTVALGDLVIEGERRDNTIITCAGGAPDATLTGRCKFSNLTLSRTLGGFVAFSEPQFEDVLFDAGMLVLGGGVTRTHLLRCKMASTSQSAANLTAGVVFQGSYVTVTDCEFLGPDTLVTGGSVVQMQDTLQATFTRCRFIAGGTATALALSNSYVAGTKRTITFNNCYFENNSSAYLLNLSSGISDLDVVFNDCTFSNLSNAQVVSLAPDNNSRIILNDCRFLQTNSAAPTSQMLVVAPAGTGSVLLNDCYALIGQTVPSGTPGFALVELGSTGGAASAGVVRVDGLTIDYASTVTNLHAYRNVWGQQNSGSKASNEFNGITVNLNGKVSAAAVAGTPGTVHLEGVSYSRRLQAQNLKITGVDYPTGAGNLKVLSTDYATVDNVAVSTVASPGAGAFAFALYFMRSTATRVASPSLRGSTFYVAGSGTGARGSLSDSYFTAGVTGTATAVGASVKNVRVEDIVLTSYNSAVEGCDFICPSVGMTAIDASSSPGNRIVGNRIVFNHATANKAIDGATTALYSVIANNLILNVNAAVPSLGAPAGSTVVANNVFEASVTVY